MPELSYNVNYKCFLCGSQAFFISFNSKQMRCTEKITQCPGHAKKCQLSRDLNTTPTKRTEHMTLMSKNGNKKLKKLHKDINWRAQKGLNISKAKSTISNENKPLLELYENSVDRITRDSYIYFKEIINPLNLLRGIEYELDHKYSKHQGFLDSISPEIIGHYSNLQLIPRHQNRKKYNKCSITKEELYHGINSIIPSDSPSSDIVTV